MVITPFQSYAYMFTDKLIGASEVRSSGLLSHPASHLPTTNLSNVDRRIHPLWYIRTYVLLMCHAPRKGAYMKLLLQCESLSKSILGMARITGEDQKLRALVTL